MLRPLSGSALAPLLLSSLAWGADPEAAPLAGPTATSAAAGDSAAPAAEAATSAPVVQTDAPSPVSTSSNQEARDISKLGPVHVTATLDGYSVAEADVATAIARELGLALASSPAAARGSFVVTAKRGADLAVAYRDPAGNELKRVVRAPENDDQVAEVAALLAVNLSQDKASEVLAGLQPKPVAEAPKAAVAVAPAAVPQQTSTKPNAPELPLAWADFTVVYPLSLLRDVERRTLAFELGLFYSDVGAVAGVAINPLVLRSRQTTSGLLIAGLGTIAGDSDYRTPQDTLRVAGLFNYGVGPLTGLGIAGFADLEYVPEGTGTGMNGVQLSGFANAVTADVVGGQGSGAVNYAERVTGAQLAGLLNVGNGELQGGQISGAANYSEAMTGVQVAGLANVANGEASGVQVSGAANIATGPTQGLQISGLVNVASDVAGAQVGILNIGKHVRGAQIGIVNIAEEVDGASVGLVTYSKKGQTQLTGWFDSTRPLNVGVRFVSGPLYALPAIGYDPRHTDQFDLSFGFGARVPVERLYFDLEGSTSNHFADGKFSDDLIDLRYRAAAGVRLTDWLGVFAGGGVRHQIQTQGAAEHKLGGFFNVGVDLL